MSLTELNPQSRPAKSAAISSDMLRVAAFLALALVLAGVLTWALQGTAPSAQQDWHGNVARSTSGS